MLRISILAFLIFLAAPGILEAQDNSFIVTWISSVFASQGSPFFDPTETQAIPVNRLRNTSVDEAKYYANFAFAATCENSLENWSCPYCEKIGSNVRYDSEVASIILDAKAYFAIDDTNEKIVLSFRGTTNVPNMLSNVNIALVPLSLSDASAIRVHAGFLLSTKSLYSGIVKRLKALTTTKPNYTVKITGASYGGALASLAVFLLRRDNLFTNTDISLFTYGEPRQGNLAYATAHSALNITSARVVHAADVVPHLPPANLGYVHHGNQVWEVNSTYTTTCNNDVFEDPACSNSLGPQYNVNDHQTYFGVPAGDCNYFTDVIPLALQLIVNMNPIVTPLLRSQLLTNIGNIPPQYLTILQPLIGRFSSQ